MDKKPWLIMVLTLAIISVIAICTKTEANNQLKIYQEQIDNNNTKISYIDDIQHSLHILAEKVRIEADNNGGFDKLLSEKWHEYESIKQGLIASNNSLSEKIKAGDKRKYIGDFTITYYCPCSKCNGVYTTTATGTKLQPYKTIAVDPKVIPLGSIVQIHDLTFVAEDMGGAIKGNRIDICAATHSEALSLGVLKKVPVFIITP